MNWYWFSRELVLDRRVNIVAHYHGITEYVHTILTFVHISTFLTPLKSLSHFTHSRLALGKTSVAHNRLWNLKAGNPPMTPHVVQSRLSPGKALAHNLLWKAGNPPMTPHVVQSRLSPGKTPAHNLLWKVGNPPMIPHVVPSRLSPGKSPATHNRLWNLKDGNPPMTPHVVPLVPTMGVDVLDESYDMVWL